jgi:hypothetical protein
MKLKDKVTSLELSKLLYEKGITKGYESVFNYFLGDEGSYSITGGSNIPYPKHPIPKEIGEWADENHIMWIPALLLSELMELMPSEIDGYNLEMEKCMIDAPYNDRPYYGCHYHSLQKGRPPYLDIGRAGILDTPLLALEALAKHLITQDLWK